MTDEVHDPPLTSGLPDPSEAPPTPTNTGFDDPGAGTSTPAPIESPRLVPFEAGPTGPSNPGADVDVVTRQLVIQEKTERGLVITVSHYARIQKRIRKEIGGHSTSIWLALSLASLSVCATIIVTLVSTTKIDAATKGKLEVAAWACFVIAVIFVVFHFVRDREKRKIADDICNEMDESSGVNRKPDAVL